MIGHVEPGRQVEIVVRRDLVEVDRRSDQRSGTRNRALVECASATGELVLEAREVAPEQRHIDVLEGQGRPLVPAELGLQLTDRDTAVGAVEARAVRRRRRVERVGVEPGVPSPVAGEVEDQVREPNVAAIVHRQVETIGEQLAGIAERQRQARRGGRRTAQATGGRITPDAGAGRVGSRGRRDDRRRARRRTWTEAGADHVTRKRRVDRVRNPDPVVVEGRIEARD